jgi:nickel-dependent lactate racemase
MNIRLPYGSESLAINVPDNWINGRCYRPFLLEMAENPRAEVVSAVSDPVGLDGSFGDAVLGRREACVVVDVSRPGILSGTLAAFLAELEAASGIAADGIQILVANSTWQPITPDILRERLDDYVLDRYAVRLHNPFNAADCAKVGTIAGDIALNVNRAYLDADLKVVFGAVQPDLLLGFAGGRSLILPGICHESTIRALLSFDRVSHPAIRFGNLRDNPIHMAGMEAMNWVGCDIAACVLPSAAGHASRLVVGEAGQAFMAAVGILREKQTVRVKEPMDIVVTSGGGDPYDSSLYKVFDTLSAVAPVLKPGGTIVISAECGEEFGPYPLREIILSAGGPRGFEERYRSGRHLIPGQWVAQRFFDLLKRHEVIIYSKGLSEDDLWATGMTPTNDIQDAIEVAMQGHGQRCKICALPDGPFSLAVVGNGDG